MTDSFSFTRRTILAGASFAGALAPMMATTTARAEGGDIKTDASAVAGDIAKLERIKVDLVRPPFVHAHAQKAEGAPKVVEFTLTIEEKKIVVDDQGTEVHAMTFNGSVPGPMMVVHQGDYVELTLINPESNSLQHNIDFHSATGALGGGALTLVNPGEKAVLRFKATKAGVFVYHCAPPGMVPWHVTSGMNGAIMVLPREGLTDHKGNDLVYDKIYYVGEQDFYVPKDQDGNFKKYESAGDAYTDVLDVMKTLTPSHIVFNGAVGALTGDNAMTAEVGDRVLIVHSQANRDTRPHLIGGHGDFVWATGKFANPPELDQETWFIPGGAAGAAYYTFQQPGIYAYVNHNLIEAFELGAAGHFKVTGDWNDDLMTALVKPES
ncbi:copper-containing nitrite reductase [Rhizobium sp. 18065]|uniref:copper-containing nitrite reductase n=1 Tax=Rhizobium sp. 18065 TaxID=2681411 RepID=UPI00135A6728|nr:copper-containing nitrite reductase [Rhizobium sp. 18065]